MGRKHLSFEDYLSRIPEDYRNNVVLLENFKGNRTKVSFKFSCGCETKISLKELLIRNNFAFCSKCNIKPQHDVYECYYCKKKFGTLYAFDKHNKKCEIKYSKLELGIDYVICSICGFHAKSLGNHVTREHGISKKDYKENNQIICNNSSNIYTKQNVINGIEWQKKVKERGEGVAEYIEKMSNAVRVAILSNPEDRKRRAKVMADVNRSDIMRKKSSDTAKITSARKDIQEKRAANMKRWRDNNPDKFIAIIDKLTTVWNSKPESLLYEIVKVRDDFNLKRHRKIRSDKFVTLSKQKDVDIGDSDKHVFIEYDGPLHFKQTSMKQLEGVQEKDRLLDAHIVENGWVLIRVGCDQFSYRKSDYGFKKECIEYLFDILDCPVPGVHYIGDVYKNKEGGQK